MTLETTDGTTTTPQRISRVWPRRVAAASFSIVLTIALLEVSARVLTWNGTLQYYKPLESQIDPQTEDWRWTHTFNDENFEPDHQLFWRPRVNHFPFDEYGNAIVQGQPPVVVTTNQPQILTYGDSNTQGLVTHSWPNELQAELRQEESPLLVLNRGVVGYSSFQGVGRLKRDLQSYQPKVIVFAFGWNDAAPSMNAPDPYFTPYPGIGGSLFAESRAYAVGVYYANQLRGTINHDERLGQTNPRMTPDQYVQQLKEMYVLAEQHGAIPIVVTRPYDSTNEQFVDPSNWRSRVPKYNAAVRALMKDDAKHLVDFEEYFRSRPELFLDESHFNPVGHREAAILVARKLEELLSAK